MPQVLAYVAIAYPFSVVWALTRFQQRGLLASAAKENKPKLFVMGSQDNFEGLGTFLDRVKRLPSPIEVATVAGVDHFFFKKEAVLCGLVEKWLRKVLATEDLKAFLIKAKEASSSEGLEQCLPKDVCQDGYQEL
jgi:alpha/beta superfamily hydrolase